MKRVLISLAALAIASAANASITPVLVGAPVDNGDGTYAWTYDATLASDQGIVSGSFFTLYDFVGFTGFGSLPANWTATSALLGKTPSKTLPDDDAALINVSFTYTGPDFNTTGPTTEQDLGNFVIFSSSNTIVLSDYTSLGKLNNGPTIGSDVATIGSNAVGVAGAAVPEPATWATLMVGMGLVGTSMRRRKRSVVVSA